MGIEEEISDLTVAVREVVEVLRQSITARELEMHGADVGPPSRLISTAPAEQAPPEPNSTHTEEAVNERTMELITLSKELGYKYLYHNGALAIDNRVLDEYNRRHLPDELEP